MEERTHITEENYVDLAMAVEAANAILQYIQTNSINEHMAEGAKEVQLFIRRLISRIDGYEDLLRHNALLKSNAGRDLAVEAADTFLQYIQENSADSNITNEAREVQLFIHGLVSIVDEQMLMLDEYEELCNKLMHLCHSTYTMPDSAKLS